MGLSHNTFLGDTKNIDTRATWISLAVVHLSVELHYQSSKQMSTKKKIKTVISLFLLVVEITHKSLVCCTLPLFTVAARQHFSAPAVKGMLNISPRVFFFFFCSQAHTHANWLKPSQTTHICIDSKNKWYESKSYCCYSFHPDKTQNAIYAN